MVVYITAFRRINTTFMSHRSVHCRFSQRSTNKTHSVLPYVQCLRDTVYQDSISLTHPTIPYVQCLRDTVYQDSISLTHPTIPYVQCLRDTVHQDSISLTHPTIPYVQCLRDTVHQDSISLTHPIILTNNCLRFTTWLFHTKHNYMYKPDKFYTILFDTGSLTMSCCGLKHPRKSQCYNINIKGRTKWIWLVECCEIHVYFNPLFSRNNSLIQLFNFLWTVLRQITYIHTRTLSLRLATRLHHATIRKTTIATQTLPCAVVLIYCMALARRGQSDWPTQRANNFSSISGEK